MPYTLWSKGRLLGHTDLGFIANTEVTKMGWFHPTEIGEQILEIVTSPSQVMTSYKPGMDFEQLRIDVEAAANRVEALDLELRSPEGEVLPVKDIGINDTERLLALARDADVEEEALFDEAEEAEFKAALDELVDEMSDDIEPMRFDDMDEGADTPWEEEKEWPRYQILVFF